MINNIFYTPKTLEELFKFHGSKFDEKTRKMMEIDYDTLFEGQKKAYSGIIHDVITRVEEVVLSGYAGTGKTHLLKLIIKALNKTTNNKAHKLITFTGQMVDTLRSKDMYAQTIHSWFYIPLLDEKGNIIDFEYSYVRATEPDFYLIEEYSNIDKELYTDIAKSGKTRIFVGDFFQNQPIGTGNDIFKRTKYLLTEISRYSGPLVEFATMLRQNKSLPMERKFYISEDKGTVFGITFTHLKDDWWKNLEKFEKIICGTNKTRKSLNVEMRKRKGKTSVFPEPGEPIMCLKNYRNEDGYLEVANGQELTVDKVIPNSEFYINDIKFAEISLINRKGELSTYAFACTPFEKEDFDMKILNESAYNGALVIDFSYAVTSYKYQGAEAETVLVLGHDMLFAKDNYVHMVYAAITRAKKKCLLVMSKNKRHFEMLHFDEKKFELKEVI